MLFKTFATAVLAGSLFLTGAAQPAAAAVQARTPAPPAQAPTDDNLKDRINFRLETSDTLRHYDIKVKVDKGVATLTGDVVTAAQKAEAGRLAKIDGVTQVQNNITLDPNEDKSVTDRMKAGLNKTGEKITDAWITTKVHWFFMGEDALKGSDINVDTKDNVVTLKGTVKSSAGKIRAGELASRTDGVKKVVNELTIK